MPWNDELSDRSKIKGRCRNRSVYSVFKAIYDYRAASRNATHWVCKSMTNVHYSKEMEAEGIRPLYIHLVRDGRDVALSFKNTIVGEKHSYHLAKQWKRDQEACEKLYNWVEPKRIIRISYENLIQNTELVLKQLFQFLKLNYNSSVLSYFNSVESQNTAIAGKMWSNVSKPIMPENTQKFKKGLLSNDIKIFENVAGDCLEKLGYQRMFQPGITELSQKQIQSFLSINNELKQEALNRITLEDLKRRAGQKELLDEIKIRKMIS